MEVILLFLLAGINAAVCQSNGDVRLVGPNNRSGVGIVEVYLNKVWGSVQPSDYTRVGQAACRQLGYDDVIYSGPYDTQQYTCECDKLPDNIPSLLSSGNCNGWSDNTPNAPTHILQCYHDYTTNPSPDHNQDLVVKCISLSIDDPAYDSQVRLVQGGTGYRSSGYVEVYLNSRWGPVCGMSTAAADTACRQLGYSYSTGHRDAGGYNSTRSAQVSSFTCSSSRQCLRNCIQYPSYSDTPSCQLHSLVNCTFSTSYSTTYGSEGACSADYSSIVAIAVGVVVAVFIVLVVIAVLVCGLCCCIPSCLLYSATRGSRRVVYETM